jgi:hypothetical protein
MRKFLLIPVAIVLLAAFGFVFAQEVNVLDPSTWFVDVDTILIAGTLLSPWAVKILTALLKDRFKTDGNTTKWVAFGISLLLAGVGGFWMLGGFAGYGGVSGAFQAIVMTLVAYFGGRGLAESERQSALSAIKRAKG